MLAWPELVETLVAAGMQADLDGITPDLWGDAGKPRGTRWQEIALCIASRGKWTEQFVILDDDPMAGCAPGEFCPH